MMFYYYLKNDGRKKFRSVQTSEHKTEAQAVRAFNEYIASTPSNHWQLRTLSPRRVILDSPPTEDRKIIEMPIGRNLQILNMKVDNHHVGESVRQVCRALFDDLRTELPRPMRRGFIKAVSNRHLENRATYVAVMSGNLGSKVAQ